MRIYRIARLPFNKTNLLINVLYAQNNRLLKMRMRAREKERVFRVCGHLMPGIRDTRATVIACAAYAPARINAADRGRGNERVARANERAFRRHERAPATRREIRGAVHSTEDGKGRLSGGTREEVVVDSAQHVLFSRAEKCQPRKLAAIVRRRKRLGSLPCRHATGF